MSQTPGRRMKNLEKIVISFRLDCSVESYSMYARNCPKKFYVREYRESACDYTNPFGLSRGCAASRKRDNQLLAAQCHPFYLNISEYYLKRF